MNYRLILKWLLTLSGAFLMLAFPAMLLPVDSMSRINDWLGLDTLPVKPITIYLARSTSLLYGVHGVLMFFTSLTLDRHWQYVWLFGWLHLLIGFSILVVDILAPMPWYWTLLEGPPVASLGVLILFLARLANSAGAKSVNSTFDLSGPDLNRS